MKKRVFNIYIRQSTANSSCYEIVRHILDSPGLTLGGMKKKHHSKKNWSEAR
jgi:hypothetical protein